MSTICSQCIRPVPCAMCSTTLQENNCSPSQWMNRHHTDRVHHCLICDAKRAKSREKKPCKTCGRFKRQADFANCSDAQWRRQKARPGVADALILLCDGCYNLGYRITKRGDGLEDFICAESSCKRKAGRANFYAQALNNYQKKQIKLLYCRECRDAKRQRSS